MSNQLIKKNNTGYSNIYPVTNLSDVKDPASGKTLDEIIVGLNMYFIPYLGTREATRLSIPQSLRKQGLWITYVDYNKKVNTEYYDAISIDDEHFKDNYNWRNTNYALSGTIEIDENGYWVINEHHYPVKATGIDGITPHLRVEDTSGKLQVSYNDENVLDENRIWIDISNTVYAKFRWFNNTIQISLDNGNTWETLSPKFEYNMHISQYLDDDEDFPIDVPIGTIVAKKHTIGRPEEGYDIYVFMGNSLTGGKGWINNGTFGKMTASVVDTLGPSRELAISQRCVTDTIASIKPTSYYTSIPGIEYDSSSGLFSVYKNLGGPTGLTEKEIVRIIESAPLIYMEKPVYGNLAKALIGTYTGSTDYGKYTIDLQGWGLLEFVKLYSGNPSKGYGYINMENSSFANCSSLKTIITPVKSTSPNKYAWRNCTSLENVNIYTSGNLTLPDSPKLTVGDTDSSLRFIIDNATNEGEITVTLNAEAFAKVSPALIELAKAPTASRGPIKIVSA